MEKTSTLTEEQLNQVPKDELVNMYLQLVYRRMHQQMLESRLIHCDETPFKLIAPDRATNSKAYMWVYHTTEAYGSHPLFLYEYQDGRSGDIPREFLKNYKGVLVTDG